jgi:hypothetical protein
MLIAFISIAHGGLGLMDPHTRAIPDFMLTMSSAVRAATHGFHMGKGEPLLLSISHNFPIDHISNSPILGHYVTYLLQLAAQACPHVVTDPIDHFIFCASIKSARDYIQEEASHLYRTKLNSIASPDLSTQLSEILIASTSFPLIGMSRSVKRHRQPNLPTCVCGSTKIHH